MVFEVTHPRGPERRDIDLLREMLRRAGVSDVESHQMERGTEVTVTQNGLVVLTFGPDGELLEVFGGPGR